MAHPINSTLTIPKPTKEISKENITNNQKDNETSAKASSIAQVILNVLQASPDTMNRMRYYPS
ncbi:MAG: hypothetical protein EB051_04140 [Chlamydiia bacterium]|nr:hypothetical protein [Chlamydiia bacterium]